MTAYYNEIDPYAAQWLRNLIDAGHIAPGVVDERSIEDVLPAELAGYTQCHFFAGLGGWSLALRLAGWPDDRPVWTGSCPCQPFSAAGKGAGFADERHLWPAWQHLIDQCRPAVIFGEQVASKAVDAWIDLVHADLEGMGYAFGGIAFPSAGVGAPHIRDRTYWAADADDTGLEGWGALRERTVERVAGSRGVAGGLADAERSRVRGGSASVDSPQTGAGHREYLHDSGRRGDIRRMADADSRQRDGLAVVRGDEFDGADAGRAESIGGASACGDIRRLADSNGRNASAEREQRSGEQRQQPQDGGAGGMADSTERGRVQGQRDDDARQLHVAGSGAGGGLADSDDSVHDQYKSTNGEGHSWAESGRTELWATRYSAVGRPGPTNGQWADADWLGCTDGKWRPVEPGTFPLAHGVSNRMGRLRAYGNAINPHQAAEFILASGLMLD